jgi:hypothetical protein
VFPPSDLFHAIDHPLVFETLMAEPGDAADLDVCWFGTAASWRP